MASIVEVIAMKTDLVQRGGPKKFFWELHEFLSEYGIGKMLELTKSATLTHDRELILKKIIDFSSADDDFDPYLLAGEILGIYKEYIEEAVLEYMK